MENGESLGDWRLTLNEINAAAATAAAPGTITGGGFSGGTVGGTAEGDSFSGGTWSGSFYGFANVVDNDLGEIRPSGVAGTFNAWTESTLRNPQADETAPSLSVQGAFGAIR